MGQHRYLAPAGNVSRSADVIRVEVRQDQLAQVRGLVAGCAGVLPSADRGRKESGILRVMIIGVGLDGRLGLPFGELRAAAQEAKRLGFESLWTPAGGVPDSFHVCAAWSQDTALRTGISVVPAVRMWTPLGLAAQAATLAQLSGGRFVLGLGTGGYGPGFWASVGLPDRPIAVMREYVTAVRGLLAGQQVTAGPVISRAGAPAGAPGWPQSASLRLADLPPAPVHLAALGPQMLRLAGEVADGALLNWATPERVAVSRELIDAGAARAGRDPGSVPMMMYIRVCVDDDVAAARQAFGAQVLGYAMGRPGIPDNEGYRGLFAQMGFGAELSELEQRRDRGAAMTELVDTAPDEMLHAVGYYGPAAPAPAAFARLSTGLDEALVRIITARPGLEPVVEAMAALTPSSIPGRQAGLWKAVRWTLIRSWPRRPSCWPCRRPLTGLVTCSGRSISCWTSSGPALRWSGSSAAASRARSFTPASPVRSGRASGSS
jgi:alkanesulfonate monooxygenase SsuD/methylene tetrahydromethanopterin reductase-like flavin-dependent oxidoreductase (luciferase family)